jgi:O-antigen ligase
MATLAVKNGWSRWWSRLAWLNLCLLLLVLPWRQRLWLIERPFSPIYPDFTDYLFYTGDLFLLGLLLCAGLSYRGRGGDWYTGPKLLWLPLLGLVIMALLSVVAAHDRGLALYHGLRLLALLGLYLFLVNERVRWRWLAVAAALSIGLQATVAVGQIWLQADLGLSWLGERPLDPFSGSSFVWGAAGWRTLQAYGLADHPNILGINLALLLLLLTGRLALRTWWRWWGAAVFALGTAALFLTFARTAWLVLAVGLLWLLPISHKQSANSKRLSGEADAGPDSGLHNGPAGAIFFLPVLLLFLPLLYIFQPALLLPPDPDLIAVRLEERAWQRSERQTLTNAANQLFLEAPLLGVGLGNFPLALQTHLPEFPLDYQPARLTLLTAAAETGLFGSLAYALALLVPWLLLWRRPERLASPHLVGITAVLLALTCFNLFDSYSWSYPAGRTWQWLIWGLWAATFQAESRENSLTYSSPNAEYCTRSGRTATLLKTDYTQTL